ncbi:MAG: hypothetical protein V4735_08175 [Pseudomonadota bacterium]
MAVAEGPSPADIQALVRAATPQKEGPGRMFGMFSETITVCGGTSMQPAALIKFDNKFQARAQVRPTLVDKIAKAFCLKDVAESFAKINRENPVTPIAFTQSSMDNIGNLSPGLPGGGGFAANLSRGDGGGGGMNFD